MVTLKEACEIVLAVRPNEHIHVVNEFNDAFWVITVPNGCKLGDYNWGGLTADIVDKRDGTYMISSMADQRLQGDYKQHPFPYQ